ncbi:MAG: nucleotide exchange factor GrpE [Muribaculaceae bacterium]|nr:nucleotide exchange factor GrpE [Muribaculaceae bacterium]
MSEKDFKDQQYYNEQGEDASEILDDTIEAQQDDSDETATEEMVGEVNLAEQLTAAREEIEKEKKEYLFLMADFDNYRKRVTREKADLIKNAGEKVLKGILPIVDDFERGLAASADATADSIRQGMELIYNKLVKYLADNGVKPMESTGEDFNADLHEAIATIPAPSEDLKGKVLDTTQKGYMINDKVLRHAKVAVGE